MHYVYTRIFSLEFKFAQKNSPSSDIFIFKVHFLLRTKYLVNIARNKLVPVVGAGSYYRYRDLKKRTSPPNAHA